MIRLTFLGRGSAFNPAMGNTNAYFSAGGDLFFLDFGESAFAKAVKLIDLQKFRHTYVLLTHLHADHCGSIASLCSYMHYKLGREITIVYPQTGPVKELLRIQGINPQFYQLLDALPADCALQALPVEVRHAQDMRCYGYLLSDGEETVYYSGDAAELPHDIAQSYLGGSIQRIYHDVASMESHSHCFVKRLEDAIPFEKRSNVYAMHLDKDWEKELKEKGFSVVQAV